MSKCYDLPHDNDYGQELDNQKARKAAKEFEWSGRTQDSARRAQLELGLLRIKAVWDSVKEGRKTAEYGIDQINRIVEEALTGTSS